jgi:hypothetical protein
MYQDSLALVNTRLLDLAFRQVPFRMPPLPVQVDVVVAVDVAVDLDSRFRTAIVAADFDRMEVEELIANSHQM